MPLASLQLSPSLKKRIQLRINKLSKNPGLIYSENKTAKPTFVFCASIQFVRQQLKALDSFGKPEGIRVLVESDKKIIAAVDFLFSGERLKLLQIYQGTALLELIAVINKLERKYSKKKESYHLELISFLPSPGFYLMATSKNSKEFYQTKHNSVLSVSKENLERQLLKIIHQKHTQNT
jgi:competence protein ComGF